MWIQTGKNLLGVVKFPISETLNDLVEMDFGAYGGLSAFLNLQDTYARFPTVVFSGAKSKGTAEMARATSI